MHCISQQKAQFHSARLEAVFKRRERLKSLKNARVNEPEATLSLTYQ